jgi:hypothetical protein
MPIPRSALARNASTGTGHPGRRQAPSRAAPALPRRVPNNDARRARRDARARRHKTVRGRRTGRPSPGGSEGAVALAPSRLAPGGRRAGAAGCRGAATPATDTARARHAPPADAATEKRLVDFVGSRRARGGRARERGREPNGALRQV